MRFPLGAGIRIVPDVSSALDVMAQADLGHGDVHGHGRGHGQVRWPNIATVGRRGNGRKGATLLHVDRSTL